MIQHQKKYFNGGLNADSDFELVKESQWVNASNIRIGSTDTGVNNRIESVGGNTLLYSPVSGSGDNLCRGGCVDDENNLILWFNYSSNGEHGIYCWDKLNAVGYKVLLTSQTGGDFTLSRTRYIHSCGVINGILYWTDGVQRRINIKAGINMNHPGTYPTVTAYTSPIDATQISLIRKPPAFKPNAALAIASPPITYDLTSGKTFRFAWRWTYREYEQSVLSEWSKVADMRGNIGSGFNSVTVGMPLENIPQDVASVELVVQYADTNKAYIIKTWDRAVTADATEITNHNLGTPLTYSFKNDQLGLALDDPYTIKTNESIPVLSETLALARSRIFLGSNVFGYDSPLSTSLAFSSFSTIAAGTSVAVFKSDTAYDFGVFFMDRYGRKCGVVKGPRVITDDFSYYTATPTKQNFINLTLSNAAALTEIPDWAYYYSIVRSRSLRTSSFIQGHSSAGQFKYAYKDASTGVITYAATLTGTPYGLAIDLTETTSAGVGYSYTEGSGDAIKVFPSTGSAIKKPIIDADGAHVIFAWDATFSGSLAALLTLFEIYTPALTAPETTYFEVGAKYAVTNPGTVSRVYSNLAIQITPDSWMVSRPFSGGNVFLEAMSPNDEYWQDWIRSETRPTAVDRIGQEDLKTNICFSNVLGSGKVNGLSEFEPLNSLDLDEGLGEILKLQLVQKIQRDGSVLLAICTDGTVSCYLGESELLDTQGSSFIAKADGVIGTTRALQGGYGTANPESVAEHNGLLWWWDVKNRTVIQYSVNGLDPISKNDFVRPANLLSKKLGSFTQAEKDAFPVYPFLVGGYDPQHKEVLFSVPYTEAAPKGNLVDYSSPSIVYPYDIYDGQAKTLVYKSDKDQWMGSHLYQAEKILNLGSDLYTIKAGKLYIHNQAAQADFYGTQYKAYIMYPTAPGGINTFTTIGLECSLKPNFVHIRTENPYTQSTDLIAKDFTTKDGVHYAPFFRDRLSPNNSGTYLQKQMIGDKIFGKSLLIMLEFDVSASQLQLQFSNIGYSLNSGHKI